MDSSQQSAESSAEQMHAAESISSAGIENTPISSAENAKETPSVRETIRGVEKQATADVSSVKSGHDEIETKVKEIPQSPEAEAIKKENDDIVKSAEEQQKKLGQEIKNAEKVPEDEDEDESFVTPGIIESQIADKKSEAAAVDIPEQNICPKCGHNAESGHKFCTKCGLRLSVPEDPRKIAQKEIPNFSDKEKSLKLEHYKRMTDKYAEKYPETVANMREIAEKAGFKNIYIVKTGQKRIVDGFYVNSIYVEESNYGKDAVFFPEEFFQNHILAEELDKDLADLGLRMTLLHEKEHCEDAAKKAGHVGTVVETEEEYQDHITKFANERGFTDEEAKKRIERITRRNEMLTESQTNTQLIFKNPEEFKQKKDVVKKIAACEAYMDILSRGIEGIRQSLSTDERYFKESIRHYDIGYRTISDKMLDHIIITQKKMEEKLIREYDKNMALGRAIKITIKPRAISKTKFS